MTSFRKPITARVAWEFGKKGLDLNEKGEMMNEESLN